jgi:hypothetical protein
MSKYILSVRLDLPFYLRLPSSIFLTWDPEYEVAAISPSQHVGDIKFSKQSSLLAPQVILDSYSSHEYPSYEYMVTSVTSEHEEIKTLNINTGSNGGFTEVRAFTELSIFLLTDENSSPFSSKIKNRSMQVLNHFLDIYRLTTQDGYVHRVDGQLDEYFIEYSLGKIPGSLQNDGVLDILKKINEIPFTRDIGDLCEMQIRMDTIEDLFPGKIINGEPMNLFCQLIRRKYDMPIHYELILNAQREIKLRNYNIAIIDAETAFEAYISNILLETSIAIGLSRKHVLRNMKNPKNLGLLSKRLIELDNIVRQYRNERKLPLLADFVNSTFHTEWKNDLYEIRNKIIHEGWRLATYTDALKGIGCCKVAITEIESRVPGLSNSIQIYSGVDHIKNTAGRLSF